MVPDQASWGSVLRHISTSSAVNPAMVVSIAAMLFGFMGLQFAPAKVSWVFIVLIILPLAVFTVQVLVFTFVDRDRLQNDKHVEQKMIIRGNVVGMMDGGKPKEITLPNDEALTSNPMLIEGRQ